MADQIILPDRVLDNNGDPVSGAQFFFYESGTDTLLTVYSDEALTTPHSSPMISDDTGLGTGVPPQVFFDGSVSARVRILESDNTLVSDLDPVPSVGTGAAASDISFAPVTGNSATNVQSAIANNTTSINTLTEKSDNATTPVKTVGSGNAYTLTAANTITGYETGQEFLVVADRANTDAATLNVDSQGPINWYKYDNTGTAVATVSGDIIAGASYRVIYDGTQFVTTSPSAATETQAGIVEKSTTAENQAGTATNKFPSVAGVVEVFDSIDWVGGPTATTSGTAVDITSLPSDIYEIDVIVDGVSSNGTDNFLIQLSTSSAFTTSGYDSVIGEAGAFGATSTAGMIFYNRAAAEEHKGTMRFRKIPGTNDWVQDHTIAAGTDRTSIGGGQIGMAGDVDGVRITTTGGTNTFDAGRFAVRYRRRLN